MVVLVDWSFKSPGGWRAPRAASGAPEAHRHTTPASALKQAPHWDLGTTHTHMRRRREDRTLPVHTHTIREHSRAREGKRRVGHTRLRTTRTMGLSKQPEAASRRRRVLSAFRRFGWIARLKCFSTPVVAHCLHASNRPSPSFPRFSSLSHAPFLRPHPSPPCTLCIPRTHFSWRGLSLPVSFPPLVCACAVHRVAPRLVVSPWPPGSFWSSRCDTRRHQRSRALRLRLKKTEKWSEARVAQRTGASSRCARLSTASSRCARLSTASSRCARLLCGDFISLGCVGSPKIKYS